MKNSKTQKLSLKKFTVVKLTNLTLIRGGDDTDDGQGDTITDYPQKPPPPPTQRPTQQPTVPCDI